MIEHAEPLSKVIYDKAKKLGIESITLRFSGGSDEGYLEVELSESDNADESFSSEIEDWAWAAYNYNGMGNGLDYGDKIMYDIKNGKVSTIEWYAKDEEKLEIAGISKLDSFSVSKIMRRCGQLGIPYENVISSLYAKSKGWPPGKCMKQHKEGMDGAIGLGEKKRPLLEKDSTPHALVEMKSLLGTSS